MKKKINCNPNTIQFLSSSDTHCYILKSCILYFLLVSFLQQPGPSTCRLYKRQGCCFGLKWLDILVYYKNRRSKDTCDTIFSITLKGSTESDEKKVLALLGLCESNCSLLTGYHQLNNQIAVNGVLLEKIFEEIWWSILVSFFLSNVLKNYI